MDKKTILIVEDELAEIQALSDKFSREGFAVLKTTNGEEGLITALKEHPDLILVDVLMPVMDGTAMIKELRKDTWGKRVPVIVLTNVEGDCKSMKEIVKEQKCRCYLIKSSWKIDDIVARAKKELGMA